MITVGVDIGGTKALAVRMDGDEVVAEERFVIDASMDTAEAVERSIELVITDDVEAVGVGVAGLVSFDDGMLVWGPHVSGIKVPLSRVVSEHFNLPVSVDNDANTAAIAEMHLGAAAGYSNVLLVTLGTGIGGAVIIDGEVYRGGGFAGEWGHVQVDSGGLLCDCGKRGCWETRASGPALVRLAREVISTNPDSSLARTIGSERITGEVVVVAADGGDEIARSLVTEVGRALGSGIADLVAIFDPELVIIGGGLGSIGESIVGPARRVLVDSLHGGRMRVPPSVQVATLGQSTGAVGAAIMAKRSKDG